MNLPRIQLHGFCPAFGLPDLSPFVLKVHTYLSLQRFPFEMRSGDSRKAPRQKLPFISVQSGVDVSEIPQLISDSSLIIQHLESMHPQPLDATLSASEKATSRLIQSTLEEHAYFLLLTERWQDEEGWSAIRPAIYHYAAQQKIPALIRPFLAMAVRKSVISQCKAQGIGRLTPQERLDAAKAVFDALSFYLGDQDFMLGRQPHVVDCTAYAFVAIGTVKEITSPLHVMLRSYPNLMAYADRVQRLCQHPVD